MRRLRGLVGLRAAFAGVLAATVLLGGAATTEVRACTGPLVTFQEAVGGAEAIAVVTVVEGSVPWFENPDHEEVFRVDRVLRGVLPPLVSLVRPKANACGDSLAGTIGEDGATAIVAFGVRIGGDVIHPVWTEDPAGGMGGTAEAPAGVGTLAELELALGGGPAASTEPGTTGVPADVVAAVALVLVALAGLLVFGWRARARAEGS
jgi:hypothetical protein